jgi:putative hemolysin
VLLSSPPILERDAGYPLSAEGLPERKVEHGKYVVRFARDSDDLDAVLRVRYEVFNLELGEGLDSSHDTGRDRDDFDSRCHHLMVVSSEDRRIIGTYRMQTAEMAARSGGFYSAGEFDVAELPAEVVSASVEVGRACVARSHRNRQVLFLLWKGLAAYLSPNRKRYLFGCCSLTTQAPAAGIRALSRLTSDGYRHPEFRVSPHPGFECRLPEGRHAGDEAVSIPILFRTYLRYGAKVCGPPAIDRAFKTIDFFVVLDIEALDSDLRRLYF